MPLPDATPDKRIYELLKTVDLENLTFSDLQAVGQSIYAEQGAEDELRRLVLLNLARLSVVGEWTGLTSAGGGGAFAKLYNPKGVTPTTYSDPLMQIFAPISSISYSTGITTDTYQSFYWWFPFYAQGDGKITDMRYRCTTIHSGDGTALDVGIYTSDDAGQPQTKIGTASLNLTVVNNDASATITETSTDSMTLTQGELYWIAYKDNGTTGYARLYGTLASYVPVLALTDYGTNTLDTYNCYATTSLPSTYAAGTDLIGVGKKNCLWLGGVFS